MSKLDVAIYAPNAGDLYGRHRGSKGGGGAELQTVLLASGLARRGVRVGHIVLPVEDLEPVEPGLQLVERPDTDEHSRLRIPLEIREIWRSLRRADPAVVVVRGSGGYVIPVTIWSVANRRQLIFASSSDLDFDLHRPDRSRLNLSVYATAARRASRLVAQTETQRRLAAKTFPKLVSRVIPSFAETSSPTDAPGEYFLWADRITQYKRPESFLDLAAAVPEARFRMVASETRETSRELLRMIEERAAALSNLELLGRLSRPELLAEIPPAVALVKTSEAEGMPNTFLESWARGVPVLSLDVDPDARIAEHGGGFVAGGSTEDFAAKARRLWAEPELRRELGARGRAFVISHHSIEAVIDRWIEVLDELTELRGVRPTSRSGSQSLDDGVGPGPDAAPAARS
jgi:glycosyltransferase involved in cell wall biosynthesis